MFVHLFQIRLVIIITIRLELGIYSFHAIEVVAFVTKSKKVPKNILQTQPFCYIMYLTKLLNS